MAEDLEAERYMDASFKGLGVAGDVATAGGLTMMATGAGMLPGMFLTAGGVGMKAVSKYGDEIADGLRKLFDMDKDAAMKAAERIDSFADDDKPIGAAISMLGAETKKARKAKNIGDNCSRLSNLVSAHLSAISVCSAVLKKLSLIWTSLKMVLVVGR